MRQAFSKIKSKFQQNKIRKIDIDNSHTVGTGMVMHFAMVAVVSLTNSPKQ